jgi:cytochrome c oxidase assembly protein subunit 11
MPVIFYIDPKIATDPDTQSVEEITLSYTFYPVDPDKQGG